MIQCPWCGNDVILVNDVCPECKMEVLSEHLNAVNDIPVNGDKPETVEFTEYPVRELEEKRGDEEGEEEYQSIEEKITNRFTCVKCKSEACRVDEVAMNGTGLSKLFDIEHRHYLFVSCTHCGYVEVYNPDVLRGHKSGTLGSVLDILFG